MTDNDQIAALEAENGEMGCWTGDPAIRMKRCECDVHVHRSVVVFIECHKHHRVSDC